MILVVGTDICSIDATNSSRIARFVNDDQRHKANYYTKAVTFASIPHVLIVAGRDLQPNEELRYDYGVANAPWRKVSK